MVARPYSVRFLYGRGANVVAQYVVPAGRRALVRRMSAVAWTETGQSLFLAVAGVVVWTWRAPGANVSVTEELRLVAYAGETLVISSTGSDMAWHLAGFLFEDAGPTAADESGEFRERTVADPLPA